MNNVMTEQLSTFMSKDAFDFDWESCNSQRMNARGSGPNNGFEILTRTYKGQEETCIYISEKVMKMLELKIGQRVLIQMDKTGRYLGMRLVKFGGFKLSSAETTPRIRQLDEGKSARCRIKFKKRFQHPSGRVLAESCFILPSNPEVAIIDLGDLM